MKAGLNEVWELINNLTLEEKKIIYQRMQVEINESLLGLLDKVNERAEKDGISLEEIISEVEKVREENYGKN